MTHSHVNALMHTNAKITICHCKICVIKRTHTSTCMHTLRHTHTHTHWHTHTHTSDLLYLLCCVRLMWAHIYIYSLHGSSLIMGVHPGCPVYLIVAASLVAVETDVWETISTAKVALLCGLWSVGLVLLSPGPCSYFCVHQLAFPWLEVLVQSAVGCKVLQRLGVHVECFYVSFADILVAQHWVASGSPPRCQLSIKNVFWDAAILHAVDMTQSVQPALSEQGEHAWKFGSGQDPSVGHCLARICPGYGGCFSGGRSWVFSPVWHMWSVSRCRTSVCWWHRQCILPSWSSLSILGWSTLVKRGKWVLWLPSQSSFQSQCPRRGCQWWWSKDMWTVQQHRVHSHQRLWLAVPSYPASGCWFSWDWWLVQNPCRLERNGQSVLVAPAGCGSSLLHHQQTSFLWWGLHKPLAWGSRDWKAWYLTWSADRFSLMLYQRRVSRAGQRRFWSVCEDTALFDAAADIKGPEGAAVELGCLFHVCVERFNHALQIW